MSNTQPKFRPSWDYDQCLRRLDAFDHSPIPWLWPGRIPLAQISLLVSRPGIGKSLLTADLASRISTASPFPDGAPSPLGSVLFICGEDSPSKILLPRLQAHHADLSKIHHLIAATDSHLADHPDMFFNLKHHETIERALENLPDCKLVVIDSIGSLLGPIGTAQESTVRTILSPLAALAERFGPAFLLIAHLNKGRTKNADDTVLGSRAFTSIPKSVWHLTRDPESHSRRLLLPGKSNFAPQSPALAFTIAQNSPQILWEPTPIEMTADQALTTKPQIHTGPEPLSRRAAEHWLKELLTPGPMPTSQIRQESQSAGMNWRTVQRAADQLQILRDHHPDPPHWTWRLPNENPKSPATTTTTLFPSSGTPGEG